MQHEKSLGSAVLFALLFGPLGLFYVRAASALIWLVITASALAHGLWWSVPVLWLLCIVDAVLATRSHNDKFHQEMVAVKHRLVRQRMTIPPRGRALPMPPAEPDPPQLFPFEP